MEDIRYYTRVIIYNESVSCCVQVDSATTFHHYVISFLCRLDDGTVDYIRSSFTVINDLEYNKVDELCKLKRWAI